ncbi:MAG: GAF domain-containing protein [Acidimicrobiia bacterium]
MNGDSLIGRLSGLISAAAAVVGEIDLERVLRRLVSEARSATGARYAALGVIGPHNVLSDFIYEGVGEEVARDIGALPVGRGVLGTVVRERRTILLDDVTTHPDFQGFPPGHPEMTSFLGVPIRAGETVFGNLYLADKPEGFTEDDASMVEALAVIAGSAVNTARLRERLKSMAVVEDRNRIARDLHDTIIQDLFAAGLTIQSLSDRMPDDATSVVLNDAVDRLDKAVEDLRGYIYELRISDELRRKLDQQLVELVERMGGAYPAEVSLETSGDFSDIDPLFTEEAVKLVTEALSNALRHARAEKVEVTARSEGEWLYLQVGDDGIGFDPEHAGRGMGLVNMRDRVHRLGGQFELETAEGAGTTVSIRLPRS